MGAVPTFANGTAAMQADLAWWIQSRPLAFLYQTTAQLGIATTTWTPVDLQTRLLDRDNGHVGASGRYTIGLTLGWYLVSGLVAFGTAGGSLRSARLVANGTTVPGSVVTVPSAGAVSVAIPPTLVQSTLVSDWLELQCFHDVSGTCDLVASGGLTSQLCVEFAGS